MKNKNTLQIYGQSHEHEAAYVIGDDMALHALRNALNEVLSGQKDVSHVPSFVSDGEGFTTFIKIVHKDEELDTLAYPYYERDSYEDRKYPFELVGKENYFKAIEELNAKYRKVHKNPKET